MTAYLVEYHPSPIESEALPPLEGSERMLAYRAPNGLEVHSVGCFRLIVSRKESPEQRDWSPYRNPRTGTWTILDGRLDGREDLRARIGSLANTARTDTELVSLLHERLDEGFVEHLRGEFTLAILDPSRHAATFARDPFGVRTILRAPTATGWVFSNELPAVVIHAQVDRSLSQRSVADFLLFGVMDWFDKRATAFRSVEHVAPGECIALRDGKLASRRYWQFPLETPPTRLAPREIPHAFRDVLSIAVAERLQSPRVLLLMSGGLDSTSVAAIAVGVSASVRDPERFMARTTIEHVGSEEDRVARLVARHLAIPHEIERFPAHQVLRKGAPTWGPVLTFLRAAPEDSQGAQPRFDTVLHAGAADNTLTPERVGFLQLARTFGLRHARHARSTLRAFGQSLPWGSGLGRLLRGEIANTSGPAARMPHTMPEWINPDLRAALALDDRWRDVTAPRPLSTLHGTHPSMHFWFDLPGWFQGNPLVGLHTRPPDRTDPFLDQRVIDFVLSLPPAPWLNRKYLLRAAMEGILPDEARLRQKVPAGNFVAPMVDALPDEVLNSWHANPDLAQFVSRDAVPRIDMALEGRNRYLNLRPLMLNLWLQDLPRWLP
jgi:asparagine synthase (glutamine-hydrolysing)